MQKTVLCKQTAMIAPYTAVLNGRSVKRPGQSLRFLIKTLLVMKLTILFLAFGLLTAHAESYSQTITFSGKNVSLVKIFNEVEQQTGFAVFANKDLLAGIK